MPPATVVELERWNSETEDIMTEETVFLWQVIEGIKFAASAVKPLKIVDLGRSEKIETTFFISSPSKKGEGVLMKDYAPGVFRDIRRSDDITTQDYLASWSFKPADIPKPDTGAGRSGSLFCFSADKRFLFKSLPSHEVETLKHILFDYRSHLVRNPRSRLMRFCALHRFKHKSGWLYLIVTSNICHAPIGLQVIEKFDLKGRKPKKASQKKKKLLSAPAKGDIWKDNQLKRKFYPDQRLQLLETLKKDAEFLREQGCIDYSLLVGVAKVTSQQLRTIQSARERHDDESFDYNRPPPSVPPELQPDENSPDPKRPVAVVLHAQSELLGGDGDDKEMGGPSSPSSPVPGGAEPADSMDRHLVQRDLSSDTFVPEGGAMGHTAPPVEESPSTDLSAWASLLTSTDEVYFMGIIDFLSRYHAKKKAAHFFKSFLWTDETLSTVPPDFYCNRWTAYLDTIMLDPSERPPSRQTESRAELERPSFAFDT